LADAGLKLGAEGISLMLNNSGNQGTGQNESQSGQNSQNSGNSPQQSPENASITAENWGEAPYWVAPDKVLDVRI
jgi:hypothetical protein